MEYFNIYTKGVEDGGLASAYIIYQDDKEIKRSAKKFNWTIHYRGMEITLERYRAHFIMEMIAIFSAVSTLPDDCTAIVYSSDATTLSKLRNHDDTIPYAYFVDALWKVVDQKNVTLILVHKKKDTCNENIAVKELALRTQRQ